MAKITSPSEENLSENFIQKLTAVKDSLRLSTTEAQSMRERLVAYADLHGATDGTASPRRLSNFSSHFFYKFLYSRAFVAGLLIFIVVLGTGTSVTYAAENALPNQPLYPVKVDVAEPIEGAVIAATSGTTGSATWENTLAERRLTEATTLAAENNLATSTQVYLETQASAAVAQSENDSAKLAAAGYTSAATSIRTDLEARLAAHAELLALMAPRLAAAGDATTTSQVATLLNDVSQDQVAVLFNPDGGAATTTSSTTVATSASSTSSSTSTTTMTTVAIAVANPSGQNFQAKEAHFFDEYANILSLLPASTTASTTATTSPFGEFGKHPRHVDGSAFDSASTTVTTMSTTTDDSPATEISSDSSIPTIQL